MIPGHEIWDECENDAVAYFPMYDEDIQPLPYCAKCLEKVKKELLEKLLNDGRYN